MLFPVIYFSVLGTWNDAHCSKRFGYVCKTHVGASPTPPAPTLSLPGNCPSGFQPFNNRCYRVFMDMANFTTAMTNCRALGQGYRLASVRDEVENGMYIYLTFYIRAVF